MIYDALVVGGGPAGATIALLLAQAGWSVTIVEKKSFPRHKVCGEFISATNLPLLEKLGIANFYLEQGGPEVRRVGLLTGETILTSAMPSAKHSLHHWGRALGREHLDNLLLKLATQAGARCWQPASVSSLQRDGSLFTGTILSNGKTNHISARTVIMANGSWERSFDTSNNHIHTTSDLLAFKSHFTESTLNCDLMPLLAFPGGYGGLVHSDNGRVTLSCCIRRGTLQEVRKQYSGLPAGEAVLQHIKTSCRGISQVLSHAKREGNWLSAGPIQPGIRQRYTEGIFYVGNRAGEAHPIVAEGISMAMQSAWILSHILLKRQNEIRSGKSTINAGREYTKQWDTHFANRIHAAALFAHIAMRSWSVALIVPLLKQFPGLLTIGAKLSGKVKQVIPTTISTKLAANEKGNTI